MVVRAVHPKDVLRLFVFRDANRSWSDLQFTFLASIAGAVAESEVRDALHPSQLSGCDRNGEIYATFMYFAR